MATPGKEWPAWKTYWKGVVEKTFAYAKVRVDKRHPEVAALRNNLEPRFYELKEDYIGLLASKKLAPETWERLNARKAAWEKDYNLVERRDADEVIDSPFNGVMGGISVLTAGTTAAIEMGASMIKVPL